MTIEWLDIMDPWARTMGMIGKCGKGRVPVPVYNNQCVHTAVKYKTVMPSQYSYPPTVSSPSRII